MESYRKFVDLMPVHNFQIVVIFSNCTASVYLYISA